MRKYKSDGLIGAAITLIKTYPSFGLGIGTSLITIFYGPSIITAFINLLDYYIVGVISKGISKYMY
ncbi:MAG: hypothetical protein ACKO96_01825 [Flammeovirgaceae bacterium]